VQYKTVILTHAYLIWILQFSYNIISFDGDEEGEETYNFFLMDEGSSASSLCWGCKGCGL